MANIKFDCPECAGSLEFDEKGAGTVVNCPQCSKPIQVPSPISTARVQPTSKLASQPQTEKPCPFCGETILAVAKKCKHCGSMLDVHTTHSDKRILPAFLLCFFFGSLGIHAFYAGKSNQGIIYIVLLIALVVFIVGDIGVWPVIALLIGVCIIGDLIRIVAGAYEDSKGNKITQWT